MGSKDTRTLADKMRDRYAAPSSAPAEVAKAKKWLLDHKEPLRAPPKMPFDVNNFTSGSRHWDDVLRRSRAAAAEARREMSDDEKRRRERREEAAYRREQQARYAREQGHVRGGPIDAESEFRQAFYGGFEEEMAGSPFFRARPVDPPFRGEEKYRAATPETEALRREEARRAREHGQDVRQQARDHAQTKLHEMRMERDRIAAERAAEVERLKRAVRHEGTPRIDRDEAGNPIYRRR